MAIIDPYLPLLSQGVREMHRMYADREWYDTHDLVNWLNENHNTELNAIYSCYQGDAQRVGDQQIGKALYKLNQIKIGTNVSERRITLPNGNRDGRCEVSMWEISERTAVRDHGL